MRSYDAETPENLPQNNLLTSPFGLADRLSAPRFRVDTIAFADLGFICLLTLFLSQSFIFSPGVAVDLPVFEEADSVVGVHADAVATVWNQKVVTVLGSYPLERMDSAFRDLVAESDRDDGTLLLLINQSTPFEALAEIYESARKAGFLEIQMAAKVDPADQ